MSLVESMPTKHICVGGLCVHLQRGILKKTLCQTKEIKITGCGRFKYSM